jgi:hypothetical protein
MSPMLMLGLSFANGEEGADPDVAVRTARLAERLGFESI